MRKYQYSRYTFTRMTDNKIFEYTRKYLAAFVEGKFMGLPEQHAKYG